MYHYSKSIFAALATLFLLGPPLLSSWHELAEAQEKTKLAEPKDMLGDPLPDRCVARCGTTRMRNNGGVRSIAYGAEGKILVAGAGGEVRLYYAQTGAPAEPTVVKSTYDLAGCSPDGKWLVTEVYGEGLNLLDLVTGKSSVVKVGSDVGPVFSGDGSLLACASGTTITVVDVKTCAIKARFKMSDTVAVAALSLSHDGKFLAASGGFPRKKTEENDIRVWDVGTEKIVARLKDHEDMVGSLAFVLGGKVLASAGGDGTVRLWDVAKWEQKGLIETRAYTMAASPDGKTLATCARDDVVRFWDADRGTKIGELATGGRHINAFAFSPDGKRLAIGAASCTAHEYDIATGKELLSLPGHREAVITLVFSPDGKTLASRSHGRTIRFWDPATGKEQRQIALGDCTPPINRGYVLAFTPDWTKLAVIGPNKPHPREDPSFQVLDAMTGDSLFTFAEDHTPGARASPPNSLAISPDGQILASTYLGVRLFSLQTGEELPPLGGPKSPFTPCAAFSPDGRILAAGIQAPSKVDTILLWDWANGQLLRSLPGHQLDRIGSTVFAMSFSPGGHVLATCGGSGVGKGGTDDDIRLWEISSGTNRPSSR